MRIATAGLLVHSALFLASCGQGRSPGSAEWCRDFFAGKIQPSAIDLQTHGGTCAQTIAKEVLNNPSFMQNPAQPGP